ncbi:MAG: nucleoside phosphorylase [Actinomycetota bacterium]
MSNPALPLIEDDLEHPGLISAPATSTVALPTRTVLCFFQDVIENLVAAGTLTEIHQLRSEIGINPIYAMEVQGETIAVVHPGVGAPLAAAFLEEMVASGTTHVVAVGGAGALVPELVLGHPMVVTEAVRDEGTSFHYLAPSRSVTSDPHGVDVLTGLLQERGIEHLMAKVWTTDAIYRETRTRVERRIGEGCVAVEMEAAAFMAVARFRKISFAQLLYAGDSLAGEVWDERDWMDHSSSRTAMFHLATQAVIRL